MNKKGELGDQAMLIVFILLLVLISVGVVSAVLIFFGSEYDFRAVSSEVLNYNIRDCLNKEGIDSNFFGNLYEKCGLNEKVISSNYIVKICADSKDCISDAGPKFVYGDAVQCGLKGTFSNVNYPKCTIKEIKVDGVSYSVVVGSKQGRRLSSE